MTTSSTRPMPDDSRPCEAPLLQVRDLSAGYGRTTVLRDVSLTVGRGTVQALLGPNGAGKTTLLRTIAGLLRPTAGSIWLNNVDVTSSPPHRRARAGICMIPEGRGVFPNLTVQENLQLQARNSPTSVTIQRAYDAFAVLKARRGQLAGSLSGGEQQMLAVARCYLSGPSLILLDEVSMGLAPLVVDQIFTSLMGLAAEGITILLVEQYVNLALEVASTVYLLNRGELTYSGPSSELDHQRVLSGYLGTGSDDR